MRSEKEMTELILRTAREDERIRGVILEGSRVNPAAPKDIFQDYDVVYAVNETRSFREDAAWIDRFGARLYMQYPEDGVLYPHDRENCYGWLIQFRDGNRLDLHVCTPQSEEIRGLYADKMHRVLLDKDGRHLDGFCRQRREIGQIPVPLSPCGDLAALPYRLPRRAGRGNLGRGLSTVRPDG